MKQSFGLIATASIIGLGNMIFSLPSAQAQQPLHIAYPPPNHQTTAAQIFIIGTAAPQGQVLVNGQTIKRSPAGHFAPSFPLKVGENILVVSYGKQTQEVKVTRVSTAPAIPQGNAFVSDSLTPAKNITKLTNELICFSAVAPPDGRVSVQLGRQIIPLLPQTEVVDLPANTAVLTATNQAKIGTVTGKYSGCSSFSEPGNLGKPLFQLNLNGRVIKQEGTGTVTIASPQQIEVVEVIAEAGVARTGPSTNYSRLTPLPQGTRASVNGKEGEWLRLDYGAWIKEEETAKTSQNIPPRSLIRSVTSRQVPGATEVIFPLQNPVPINIEQGDGYFTITFYNTTAQTDTIRLNDDVLIKRLDWQQVTPEKIEYTFELKSSQQWGYDLRYEGTTLILSLRHPPQLSRRRLLPLQGISILLDPGHGGDESGAKGPTGYPEKDINLAVSLLLKQELEKRGARVYLTREDDREVSLVERVKTIELLKPTLALSIHYNALPDNGDAMNTSGVGMFWYHSQAHDLAVFLHNYLVERLPRPSYGVFWNNLALTRPHTAPTVLMELGFMINPFEFEWISDRQQQAKLATVIADGITTWLTLPGF